MRPWLLRVVVALMIESKRLRAYGLVYGERRGGPALSSSLFPPLLRPAVGPKTSDI
jgi:hypothetical protein